jgi:hypothetical protein
MPAKRSSETALSQGSVMPEKSFFTFESAAAKQQSYALKTLCAIRS